MDSDMSGWVLEFLLRSSVPDSTIQKTLAALPLSGADPRLKKTLLLRTLHSYLINASLSETALEILELLEQLHLNDAVPAPDSLRRAYCAVAVECTVKYLAASPDDPSGEYFSAVRRIWRGRIAALTEDGRPSGLVSDDLERWRHDVEAVVWDPRVSERVAGVNTRWVAMVEVRGYLKEAWEIMGASFLDLMATGSKGKGLRLEGVCENDSVRKRGDGGLECSAKRADRNEFDDNDDNGTECHMEGVTVADENQGEEQFEDTVDVPAKGNQGVQKENIQLKRKLFVLQKCQTGVQISGAEKVVPKKSRSNYHPLPSAEVKKVRESLRSSSLELRAVVTDPLPDALHTSEVVRSNLSMKDTMLEPHITENQSGDVYLPDPNACRSIVPFLPNIADLGKKSSVHCSNVDGPNLMERRSNAQTFEWNDSIESLPQEIQPRRRKMKWTSLEEETLRAGVKMFGEGNWKTIRNCYSNIFEIRSAVDLKDKWRNMLR